MIECNPLLGGNGRTRDGVKVFTRFSKAWIWNATGEILLEEPIGAQASEYTSTFGGRLRCDQTGKIYEIAHDIEDSPYTYTEVFPTPESYCEIGSYGRFNTHVYPDYKAAETYSEGDIVVYNKMTWISEFDDNTGNTPTNLWGWSVYLPYVEERNVVYKSLEEMAG